ncbi:hypothetical protein GIB67_014388 [Kingdonia uniflora]|uniref:F-box associated beta-propeller type 3 domain-containing protein n=1 Tax=Kingdonia uniflora TaxID=39325 RepID=A0A7J7LZ60_9MAGN|nr:hypothetical protein GIB67_014388 [Kingdonia uniflora]
MGTIPQDAIDDIFRRLLVESLETIARCKYFSKRLFCLISDSCFVKLHLEQAKESKQYKIMIKTYPISDSHICKVCIYSLRNNSWRKIPTDIKYGLSDPGVLVNGILHWIVVNHYETILSFDLKDETFHQIYIGDVTPTRWALVVWEKTLSVVKCAPTRVDLWVMIDYGIEELWTNLFRIELQGIVTSSCSQIRIYNFDIKVLQTSMDGEVLLKTSNGDLVWYNIKEKKGKKLRMQVFEIESYIESLVSLLKPGSVRWTAKVTKTEDLRHIMEV